MIDIELDENLWFNYEGCEGKHYLIDNPHTFPGRMMAWCPNKKNSFFISKSEIVESSEQTIYWIKGFLNGNQPSPPIGNDGMTDFKSAEYLDWKHKITEFNKTGYWDINE